MSSALAPFRQNFLQDRFFGDAFRDFSLDSILTNDSFFDDFFGSLKQQKQTFPPHNIEEIQEEDGSTSFLITVAVAGYGKEDLNVERERDVLRISGGKTKEAVVEKRKFVHQGIAARKFELRYFIPTDSVVEAAKLENGVLTVKVKGAVVQNKSEKIAIQ